jgi:hypothetical protein
MYYFGVAIMEEIVKRLFFLTNKAKIIITSAFVFWTVEWILYYLWNPTPGTMVMRIIIVFTHVGWSMIWYRYGILCAMFLHFVSNTMTGIYPGVTLWILCISAIIWLDEIMKVSLENVTRQYSMVFVTILSILWLLYFN